jgi:hypothetical protein
MKVRQTVAALCVVTVVTSLAVVVPSASANHGATYEIQMGAALGGPNFPGDSFRFYPQSVRVHENDTIHFTQGAPWVLPAGEDPTEWREANASELDDPFFFFHSDADDGPGQTKVNADLFFNVQDCGTSDNHCTWDGSAADALNIGEAEEMFVDITAAPGTVIWAVSPGFSTASNFRIEVVDDTAAPSTQGRLDRRAAALLRRDRDDARAIHNRFVDRRSKHVRDGVTFWDAWGGLSQGPLEFFAMYPANLRIRRGQRVQWHFPLENEPHSVVFSARRADRIANRFFGTFEQPPVCDPDGDDPETGTAPDTPPDQEGPPFCSAGEAEFEVKGPILRRQGNRLVTSRSDDENSGLKGPESHQGGFFDENTYTLRFRRSPERGFRYACSFHGSFMSGRVIVR